MRINLSKILMVLIVAIIIYSVIWAVYVNVVYTPYTKALGGNTTAVIGDYEYTVYAPTYPSFAGNLAVNEIKEGRDVYNESTAGLIIWPGINGKCKIHVMMETPKEKYDEYSSGSHIYGFDIDTDLNPDMSTNESRTEYNEHKEFFEDNWDKIEDIISNTKTVFDISSGKEQNKHKSKTAG